MDISRDQGVLFADVLSKAGVRTKLDIYPEGPHCFWSLFPNTALGKK